MPPRPAIERNLSVELQALGVDGLIARLGARQHGSVARWQLLAHGVSRHEIEHRVRTGRLIPVHRGVYAVGHAALARHGRRMAAVLTGGAGAVLLGRSAAEHWVLRPDARSVYEIATPRSLRPLPGILRRQRHLPADETTVHEGIPVTTVARTLLDLAAVLDVHRLRRVITEAERQRLGDRVGLPALVRRHPRSPGVAKLRAILAREALDADATESELELDFVAFAAAARLPAPRTGHPVGPFVVDAAWPAGRVAVEVDSRAFHADPQAFEDDRRRDRILAAAGWLVVRVTARQLREEPGALAADLRALLDARAGGQRLRLAG